MSAFVIVTSLFLLLISGESLGQVIRVSSRSEHVGGNQTKSSKMQSVELLMPERRDNERSGGNSLHLPNDRSENIEINVKLSQGGSQSNQGIEGDSQRIFIEQNSIGAVNQLPNERNHDIQMILNQIREKTNAQQRQIESQQILIESISPNQLPSSKTLLSQQNNDLKANLRSMQSQLESLQILLDGTPQQTMNSTSNQSEAVDGRDELERKKREILRLESTIQELQSHSCATDSSNEMMKYDMHSCPKPENATSVEFPPQCCSFPFTLDKQLHYRCTSKADGLLGCLIDKRTWVHCAEPSDFVARNQTVNIKIPFVARFTSTSVHNWIVLQQRVPSNNTTPFNRSWEEFKVGFGSPDGNFWLGLEKVHKMTNNAPYKLRIEFMLLNGSWYSAEYDTFRVGSEAGNYTIHVTGYSGDSGDVMNGSTGNYNTMPFSTYDRGPRSSTASAMRGGWWHDSGTHHNLNGLLGKYFGFDIEGRGCTHYSTSRMMMKKI